MVYAPLVRPAETETHSVKAASTPALPRGASDAGTPSKTGMSWPLEKSFTSSAWCAQRATAS